MCSKVIFLCNENVELVCNKGLLCGLLCGSQPILEVKMLDVEVLGWCGYTWSVVVRLVGFTAKFSETTL